MAEIARTKEFVIDLLPARSGDFYLERTDFTTGEVTRSRDNYTGAAVAAHAIHDNTIVWIQAGQGKTR